MTSASAAGVDPPKISRTRDAGASKEGLLQAAQDLFGQNGFERTTIREIGERAGVDAALIARYFGNKADLYIAAVAADDLGENAQVAYEGLGEIIAAVMTRADDRGPGPILQAVVRSDTSAEIREAAQDRLARRLVDPLASRMANNQVERPHLRAEIAISAMFGISLGRALGWFEDIRSVPRDELVALVVDALGAFTGEAASPSVTP